MSNVSVMKVDPNSRVLPFYNSKNITTQVSTPVKSSAGFLHTITLNKPTATTVIEIADVGTATTVLGTITIPASPQPCTLTYDIEFSNALAITTSVANSDITVSYL